MLRVFYAVVIGIIGAGIVHIAILLLLPAFAERDAWSRLSMAADLDVVIPLDALVDGEPLSRTSDPLFRAVACRFDLSESPITIAAKGRVPFWSASVYDRAGQNIYSLNDRAQTDAKLDLALLTGNQLIDLRKDMPAALDQTVLIEVPVEEGIVVVRAFVPDPTWSPTVAAFMTDLKCAPL